MPDELEWAALEAPWDAPLQAAEDAALPPVGDAVSATNSAVCEARLPILAPVVARLPAAGEVRPIGVLLPDPSGRRASMADGEAATAAAGGSLCLTISSSSRQRQTAAAATAV